MAVQMKGFPLLEATKTVDIFVVTWRTHEPLVHSVWSAGHVIVRRGFNYAITDITIKLDDNGLQRVNHGAGRHYNKNCVVL